MYTPSLRNSGWGRSIWSIDEPAVVFSVTATWRVASGASRPGTAGVSGPISRPASMIAERLPTSWTRSLRVSWTPGEGSEELAAPLDALHCHQAAE